MTKEEQVESDVLIGSFVTGIALGDNFFATLDPEKDADEHILMPISFELYNKCKGVIRKPGIYKFELRVVKLK